MKHLGPQTKNKQLSKHLSKAGYEIAGTVCGLTFEHNSTSFCVHEQGYIRETSLVHYLIMVHIIAVGSKHCISTFHHLTFFFINQCYWLCLSVDFTNIWPIISIKKSLNEVPHTTEINLNGHWGNFVWLLLVK